MGTSLNKSESELATKEKLKEEENKKKEEEEKKEQDEKKKKEENTKNLFIAKDAYANAQKIYKKFSNELLRNEEIKSINTLYNDFEDIIPYPITKYEPLSIINDSNNGTVNLYICEEFIKTFQILMYGFKKNIQLLEQVSNEKSELEQQENINIEVDQNIYTRISPLIRKSKKKLRMGTVNLTMKKKEIGKLVDKFKSDKEKLYYKRFRKELMLLLFAYYKKMYFDYNIDARIEKSDKEEMNNIKIYYSLILNMDNEFRKKPFVEKKLLEKKKAIFTFKKESRFTEENNNPFNEFYNNQKIKKGEKRLKKIGKSFLINKNTSLFENLAQEIEDLVKRKKIPKEHQLLENKNYSDYIKVLFVNKLDDFRKEIVEYFIFILGDDLRYSFSVFISLIEFFAGLFSGLNVKYYIDEFGYLDLDFFVSESVLFYHAAFLRYQVQFRILDIPYVIKQEENKPKINYVKKGDELIQVNHEIIRSKNQILLEKNAKSFSLYDFNDVENFPPYVQFSNSLINRIRRYDNDDDSFHLCYKCVDLKQDELFNDIKCSSCFRSIDKNRLVNSSLASIMNLKKISSSINDKSDQTFYGRFKAALTMNQKKLKNKGMSFIILSTISPFETKHVKRFNNIIRNTYGEEIGYFFYWSTHFIKWLLFPSILGILLHGVKMISFYYTIPDEPILFCFISFAGLIIIWGDFYVESWKSLETVYNYVWGMESYRKLEEYEISNKIAKNKDVILENFMGIQILTYNKWKRFFGKTLSFFAIMGLFIITAILNIGIFYIANILNRQDSNSYYTNRFKRMTKGYYSIIPPFLTYVVREIMSAVNKKACEWLSKNEGNFIGVEYYDSLKKKILIFEFFNYYFNLYYIAFVKRYFDTCQNNDCFYEIGNQLSIIIMSNLIVMVSQLLYDVWDVIKSLGKYGIFDAIVKVYRERSIDELLEQNVKNLSSKSYFYSRRKMNKYDLFNFITPMIFNFGYIIQFGICFPTSFFFELLLVITKRVIHGFSMNYLYYVQNINSSTGIGVFKEIQSYMVFLGLFSNLSLIFYTNNKFIPFNSFTKVLLFLITENVVYISLYFLYYDETPKWFTIRDKIENKYLQKFGIKAKNKKIYQNNKKSNSDNNLNELNFESGKQ